MACWVVDITCQDDFYLREKFSSPWGSHFIFGGKIKKSRNFLLDLLCPLNYTCYHGESIHIAHQGWLNLTEHTDWPPLGLIWSLGECFTLREVQAMSLGGIQNHRIFHSICYFSLTTHVSRVIAYTELAEGGLTSTSTMTGLLEVWSDIWENVLTSGRYR